MTKTPATKIENDREPLLNSVITGVLFGMAGFALNWFKLELYFNVDFLFGSVISMFALMRFGLVTGTTAALIASSCSWYHWNHPWAIVIFTAEALCTGLLWRKRDWDTVVANLAFWFSAGLLLVLVSYQLIMGFSFSSSLMIALKQGINGIANTLMASALYIGYCYWNRPYGKLPSLRQLIFVTISLFVVIPAFVFLNINIRGTLSKHLANHTEATNLAALAAQKNISLWFQRSHEIVRYIAATAAQSGKYSSMTIQIQLDAMRLAMPEFKRLAVVDSRSITKAFSPATDETGASTIGLDLSDRPFIKTAQTAPHPAVTSMIRGRIGKPGPRLMLVVPIVFNRSYHGAALGIMELDSLKLLLHNAVQTHDISVTLVDDKGLVVLSTQANLKPLTVFTLPKNGTFKQLSSGVSHWIPNPQAGVGAAKRWMSSFYLKELPLDSNPGWKLVVVSPLRPTLSSIGSQTSKSLAGIGVLLVLLIYFSRMFSSKLATIVSDFEKVTHQLPAQIEAGETIEWPIPATVEIQGLTDNVRQMCETIQNSHSELLQLNETLEQRVEERSKELEYEKQRLADIIYGTNIGTWEWNIRSGEAVFNERWAEIIGYSLTELEPISIQTWLDLVHPDDARISGELLERHFSRKLDHYDCECRMRHREGHWIWVHDRGKVVSWTAEGSPLMMSGTHQDISERKRQEEELKIAKTQAESANRAKSEFLANMSHEIRTPMNGVIGMTHLLEYTELTSEQREYVKALKASGSNLLGLINDILDLSKIEAGRIRIELSEFSLRHCIEDVVLAQKSELHNKNLALHVNVADDVPRVVTGDQLRLKQIILNLLGNAIKFTIKGCITISAQLVERHDNNALIQISVRDTGIGISAEALEKIFKPFVQEDGSTTRRFGGTGLGLTISRRLTELMGGRISVESLPEAGSCFKVTIPFQALQQIGTTEETGLAKADAWDGPPLRILLVEDNRINRTLGTSLLGKMGHDVIAVENGRECLDALKYDRFDLILMDIQMPLMNGEEALREIRSKELTSGGHLPVIAVTAFALEGDREKFLLQGFDGYLAKPIESRALADEIKRVPPACIK